MMERVDKKPTQAVAEREASLTRREPPGGRGNWIAQSPRMLQQKATLQALFGPAAWAAPLPIQREVLKTKTDSEDAELTYSLKGTVHLSDGTPFTGIILVLVYTPKAERGKKYGGHLMERFMTEVVKKNACYLDVIVSDTGGLNSGQLVDWYKRYGFKVLGNSTTGPVMGINMPEARQEPQAVTLHQGVKLVDYSDSDSDDT
jgi:hypothetical protein